MTFRVTRGETLSLAIEAFGIASQPLSTNALNGVACRADLKASRNGGAPGDLAPRAAQLTVTPTTEVVPGGGPGFVLTLNGDATAALSAGNYVIDARTDFPSGLVITAEPQRVVVEERVTV